MPLRSPIPTGREGICPGKSLYHYSHLWPQHDLKFCCKDSWHLRHHGPDAEHSCFQLTICFCYWCKHILNINEWVWSLKITWGRKRASHTLDNVLSLCISLYFSLCNQKRPDNRIRDTCKVKHICFCRTRGKMWSYKNIEKAPLFEVKSPFNQI